MEITVSKTALSDKLKSVGRIIQPKNSLPAYDNFLFVIDEFGVILVTAGEEGGRISTNIDGTADFTNYTFMANAKTLLDGLKEIPEQPLIISILEKELIVKYANGKFSIPIEKGDQYPSMSTDDTASPFLVSGNDFNKEFDSVKRLLEKYLTRITENTELKKHQSIQDAFSSYVEFEEVATCKQTAFINSFFSNMDIRFDFDIDRHGDLSYNECLTKDEELRYYIDKKLNNDNFKKENLIPNTLILNFNYTKTAEKLYIKNGNDKIINIHGELNNENNPIIFGYGDELDDDYERIERLQNNDFLENIKSIRYHKTRNYRKLLEFVALGPYQVFIMGHSCGNSDRTLLNTLFEHDNCLSIKVFYRQYEDGTDNYIDMIKNISRNFNNKPNMRDIVVNRESCSPLVPVKKEVAE